MRGLAALFVVVHHAYREVVPEHAVRLPFGLPNLLETGHQAVAVFIVLSGFCLGLPVARDPHRSLSGGWLGYLRRRMRRILPPYYAALALALLLVTVVPEMDLRRGDRWDEALPARAPDVIVSHLLLIHNLRYIWCFRIDPPMWSVATEWQIYLVFPWLLVIWRRFGLGAVVGSAFAVGYGLGLVAWWQGWGGIRQLCPWYLGLFALGVAAAAVVARDAREPRGARPWLQAAVCLALGLLVLGRWPNRLEGSDPFFGAAAACLVVACASAPAGTLVRRALEARWALRLGAVSYSLYLVHYPILSLVSRSAVAWPAEARAIAVIAGAVPLSLATAYAFHLAFERPFQTRRNTAPRSGRIPQAAGLATIDARAELGYEQMSA
jgi:peptidoglycan/LPS O-acetylase OafA/YrhL